MIVLEKLPVDIQHMIWEKARTSVREWKKDLDALDDLKMDALLDKEEWSELEELFIDEFQLMQVKYKKTRDYIDYMRESFKYDLGISKTKPWPHYKPKNRKCSSCGYLAIPIQEPSWKNKCIECFKHEKYPWKYGFR